MSIPAKNENVEDTQAALETALTEKSKYQKESETSIKELKYFDSNIGPITILDFQRYVRERSQPVFDKHNTLCSSDYSRDASLGHPL